MDLASHHQDRVLWTRYSGAPMMGRSAAFPPIGTMAWTLTRQVSWHSYAAPVDVGNDIESFGCILAADVGHRSWNFGWLDNLITGKLLFSAISYHAVNGRHLSHPTINPREKQRFLCQLSCNERFISMSLGKPHNTWDVWRQVEKDIGPEVDQQLWNQKVSGPFEADCVKDPSENQ